VDDLAAEIKRLRDAGDSGSQNHFRRWDVTGERPEALTMEMAELFGDVD
jgi:hypothetical protein